VADWAELAELGVAAYDALDAKAFAALCADDVEVVPLIGAVEGGEPYRGAEGIATWFRELGAAFASIETAVERVHDLGDAGVVELRGHNRGRASGAFEPTSPAAASAAACISSTTSSRCSRSTTPESFASR
jgi:ketosteroid isomerase-like protein